jgi:hypothetical protein
MKQLKQLIPLSTLLLVLLTSCVKEAALEEASEPMSKRIDTTGSKSWLTAHTWQIKEVIDPITGTRYKRGVSSDGKNFGAAYYTYKEDQTITGMDWNSTILVDNSYTLLDNGKIRIVSPACTYINHIITLSATEFSYKTIDGSVFILEPRGNSNAADQNK